MSRKKNYSLNYSRDAHKITPFNSKQAARAWLKKNNLDINGTPILLPFYNQNKCVEFLNPGDDDDRLRVMGDGVAKKPRQNILGRGLRRTQEAIAGREFMPHLKKQKESIPIGKNDFLIVYQKNEQSTAVGKEFYKLYLKMKMDLEQKIQASQTHDAAQINPAELVQELSTISMNLNIVAGICYFIIEDKNRNLTVYRHIFKEGLRNKKIQDFLAKEKESKINDQKMAVAIQIENNKTIKTHRIAFIKDFLAGLFTLGLTAFTTVGAITLCMLVIPLPYSLIAAAAAAAASAIILPGIPLLYKKAIEKNKPTIEFAKTFTTKVLGADEIDSALPSALQADPTQGTFFHLISPTTVMPRKTEPTVLVRSFSDKRPFVNRLASINEEEEEKNKQPESSLGIYRH